MRYTLTAMNDYIHRIHAFPGVIVGGNDGVLSTSDEELVRRKIGAAKAVYCEIGSGSGGHLLELARRNSEALYVAFELRFKRIVRTAEKAAAQGISNILLLHVDATRIGEFFAPACLHGIYVNFPDPWWDKRKWSKHRLLSPSYVQKLRALLRNDGLFSFKSDHPQYFDLVVESAANFFRAERLSRDLHSSEYAESVVLTEFEKMFKFKQLPVHWVEFRPIT